MNDGSNHGSCQDSQHGIFTEYRECLRKNRGFTIGFDCIRHKRKADKQNTEANQDFPDFLLFLTFCKKDKKCTDAQQKRGKKFGLHNAAPLAHGYDPCGYGGTDICPHNNAHGLGQFQHSGINKAYYHDCCGGRALYNGSYPRSYENSHQPVFCQKAHQLLHSSTGRFLKAVGHDIHSIKEHAETSDE